MTRKKIIGIILLIVGLVVAGWAARFYNKNLRGATPAFTKPNEDIVKLINTTGMPLTLPPGFSISVFAKDLGDPRVMIRDQKSGNLLVSLPNEGKVIGLMDGDNDGISEVRYVVAQNLNHPHGLASRCQGTGCELYIAEEDKVVAYETGENAGAKTKLFDLPSGGNHITRTIMFESGPGDGLNRLLVSVGSSCNVCRETDPNRAKILVYDFGTKQLTDYATGLRNSVFMAINPRTKEIWATENSRDLLGDDIPPDEINIIQKGKNYGWPNCYGKNIHDTDFDKNTYIRNPCMEPFETPSYIDIQAHSAPLGLAFFPEEGWPDEYKHNLLVAYHGSWNRTEPTGYKIVRYKLGVQGNVLDSEDFITGWLKGGDALGRPVDILIEPNGKIFISDDKAGVIYLVRYTEAKQ